MNPRTERGILPDISFFFPESVPAVLDFIAFGNPVATVEHCYSLTCGGDEDFRYGRDGLSDIISGLIRAVHRVVFYMSAVILSGVVENCARSSHGATD